VPPNFSLSMALDFRKLNSSRTRRWVLSIAVIGFVAGIVFSIHKQPDILHNLQSLPVILLIVVATPITVVLNTSEFLLSARLIGQHVSFRSALEITIVSIAANMLPLPGSAMVRVAALKAAGASYKHGASTILFVALIWMGVAFLYAGLWVIDAGDLMIGGLFCVAGSVILMSAFIATLRFAGQWRVPLWIVGTRFLMVIVDAVRMYLCLWAFGVTSTFAQASVFVVSSVLGSAISLVPAGLGVREVVAAAIAPIVALAASSVFLAASLNRILGFIAIAPFAALVAVHTARNRKSGQSVDNLDE